MGQLVTPQKTHTMPSPAPKEGCSPSRGAAVQPKVAPVKTPGRSRPLEARPQGNGGKEHLQQERLGPGLPSDGGVDHRRARPL